MSTGASYMSHPQTTGMPHYPSYHTQPTTGYSYSGLHHNAYGYPGSSYSTSQGLSVTSAFLPPPPGTSTASHGFHSHPGYGTGHHQQAQTFDQSGQIQPVPHKAPKITATLWEDEGTLCFQVEGNGVCVARREDNNFINGTKLLNVAGMTRGRRDGILKSEKQRSVVKIGPMHLKGVWIPFEKALEFANRERITELLYPLFVNNISQLMTTIGGGGSEMPRALDAARLRARAATKDNLPGSTQLPSQVSTSMSSISQLAGSRPAIERSQTFPTPPTSASSMISGQNNSYDWGNSNMTGSIPAGNPLAIDTTLSNSRSLPNTPASTPPGNTVQSMQSYPNQSGIGQYSMQSNMTRYGQQNAYIKSEMGPPIKSMNDPDQNEIKSDSYVQSTTDTSGTTQDSYGRSHYLNYNGMAENTMTSPDQVGGSPHQTASGRVTPRNSMHSQQWTGYDTPPRSDAAYSGTPASTNNGTHGYGSSSYTPTSLGGAKRAREDDTDDYKTPRSAMGTDYESMKRRRGGTESSVSSVSTYDPSGRLPQGSNTIMSMPRLH